MPKVDAKAALKKRLQTIPKPAPFEPLWKGPSDSSETGGISQSMLQQFLVCRERFRVQTVLGLRPADSFRHALEYGNMGHVCEEAWAKAGNPVDGDPYKIGNKINLEGHEYTITGHLSKSEPWEKPLLAYVQGLLQRYPLQQEQVVHWYRILQQQFPRYIHHWARHKDSLKKENVLSESVFDVNYLLPSGRAVRLRGKIDSADIVTENRKRKTWLQENKYQGTPDESDIKNQLLADLQTGIYLIALCEIIPDVIEKAPLAGVRYNVVRRPLAGGKHSIRQHQPTKSNPAGESKEAFYNRLGGLIEEDGDFFFMRWNVDYPAADLERFKRRILNPILEQLCDWWDFMEACEYDPWTQEWDNRLHWQHPYGVYNVINEGGRSDVEEYLASGSTTGLERANDLFPELR